MSRPVGDFEFNSAFDVNASKPIDTRFVVDSVADLTNLITYPYVGLLVFVIGEDKYYHYHQTSNNVYGWSALATGGTSNAVTSVKVGTTAYNPTNGVVSLPAYPILKDGEVDFGGSDRDAYGYGTKEGLSPCDTLFTEIGGNRFAFMPASLITVEYSRDGGSTWTDYGSSDNAKKALFTLDVGTSFTIGKADSTNKATTSANYNKYMLRVTINTNGTTCYARFKKFILNISTNGSSGSCCDFQGALQGSPTTFTTIKSGVTLSGWSGYNVINLDTAVTTYGNRSDQYQYLRWVFRTTAAGNTSYNGLTVYSIKGFADTAWNVPSTMARTGHLYSYDESGAAAFPGKISASCLNLTGGKTTGSGDDEGLVIGFANNNYAGMCLGNPSGLRSVFYLNSSNLKATWRYNNGTTTYDIEHPQKAGTIALTSDIPSSLPASDVYSWAKASSKPSYNLDEVSDGSTRKLANYLPLSGGTITGNLTVNGLLNNNNFNATDGNGLLAYKPTSWTAVSSSQWGVGAGNCQGVIRSSNADLIHYKGGTNYTIFDSSNLMNGGYVPMPLGANYSSNTSSVTGALKITFPLKYTSSMLSFWVDIYNYTEGTMVSYLISGYNYIQDNKWYNVSAICIGSGAYAGLNVRFGDDGTKCCVLIGETSSTWSYPQVIVRDFYHGYSNVNNAFASGWSVSYVTTMPSNISKNITSSKFLSGTVAIANGGTGATTRLGALQNLTSENVSTSAQYFLTITDNWGKGGYTSVADAKSVLGLKSAAYTESSAYATASHTHSNYLTSVPAASSSTRGGAKIYASGDILYISTT